MESTEVRMNCKVIAALVAVVGLSLSASATIYTFPTAGGDLSSPAAWGGTRPTAADGVNIDQAGTYTLSENVSFSNLSVKASGCIFNFGNYKMTLKDSTNTSGSGLFVSPGDNARTVFSGGTYDLLKTTCAIAAYNVKNANTVFTNGCIVTNAYQFQAGRYNSGARTEIAGNAKVYATTGVLGYDQGAKDNTLEIYDGGQLHVSGALYGDINGTENAYGGHRLFVHGPGSAVYHMNSNLAQLGFRAHSIKSRISDFGLFSSANGGLSMARGNNSFLIDSGATGILYRVRYASAGNSLIVSNATFTCRNEFSLGYSGESCSNNLFRAYGADTKLTFPSGDLFSSREKTNSFCTVSLEGGVKWNCGSRNFMMARTHHSTFQLVGAGTTLYSTNASSGWFYIGDKDITGTIYSISNRFAILDGAMFKANRIHLMGIDNELCVSNATLHLIDDTTGLRIGWGGSSTNATLVLQGETPKVRSEAAANHNGCAFNCGSKLRFEIPEQGYAKGYVPFEVSCPFAFDGATCKLEIDCDDFVAKTGGKLHLIHAYSINDTTATRMRNTCTLPEGCELIISGGDVYIKSKVKNRGFAIIYR